jgi:hypothetical protein
LLAKPAKFYFFVIKVKQSVRNVNPMFLLLLEYINSVKHHAGTLLVALLERVTEFPHGFLGLALREGNHPEAATQRHNILKDMLSDQVVFGLIKVPERSI